MEPASGDWPRPGPAPFNSAFSLRWRASWWRPTPRAPISATSLLSSAWGSNSWCARRPRSLHNSQKKIIHILRSCTSCSSYNVHIGLHNRPLYFGDHLSLRDHHYPPLHLKNRTTDLAGMPPQDWADELVRDGTPKIVTEVSSGRLAVVLAKFAQSPAHPPQSLWVSVWLRQLRRHHWRHVRLGVWE